MEISEALGDSRFDGKCIPEPRAAIEQELERIRGRHVLSIRKALPLYDCAYGVPPESRTKVDQKLLAMGTELLMTLLQQSLDFTFTAGSGSAAEYQMFAQGAQTRLQELIVEARRAFLADGCNSDDLGEDFGLLELQCTLDRILQEMITKAWSAQMENFQSKTDGLSGEPRTASPRSPEDRANGRRKAVDAYIKEVFDKTGKRITRAKIWQRAGYKSRTEFERWQRNDKRANKTADRLFNQILSEKPHLKETFPRKPTHLHPVPYIASR